MVNTGSNLKVTDNLRVCHVNCQSFFAHLDEFRNYFQAHFFHVICWSETWLKPGISNSMIHLQDYILLRCDRLGKNGREVGVYIYTSIDAKLLATSES